jgi:hypothetical protein
LRCQVGHFKAFTLELATGVQHGFVFGLAGDDVLAFLLIEIGSAFNRQVVGFGCSGSEHDFARVSANQFSNLVTGDIYRFFRLPPETVGTGSRVTESPVQSQNCIIFSATRGSTGVVAE